MAARQDTSASVGSHLGKKIHAVGAPTEDYIRELSNQVGQKQQ